MIAAEAVTLHPDRRIERALAPPFGKEWSWVEALAPPFVLEGATLESFLNWVSGELGLRWRYADRAAERYGQTVVLHGSIEGLTPSGGARSRPSDLWHVAADEPRRTDRRARCPVRPL